MNRPEQKNNTDRTRADSARLVSVQVGVPTTREHPDGDWTTAFFKSPVDGARNVTPQGLDGDGQADMEHHGGVDKAVLAYSADHYPKWHKELEVELTFGGFGENLTIAGIDEKQVCIGDRWQIGGVEFEVSQPRRPCWKLARRWDNLQLPKMVVQTGRSGWYFRVKKTGVVTADAQVSLLERPYEHWSIERINELFYAPASAEKSAANHELSSLDKLADAWKHDII